jgi:Protein of unknown function (DUF3307)
MQFIATLFLAHLLADFPLQTNRIAALKQTSIRGLALHIAIYVAATWLLLGMKLDFWPLVFSLGLVHFVIDWYKVKVSGSNGVQSFLFDQLAHILSILVLANSTKWISDGTLTIIPEMILYPALIWAFFLAVMVFCWVWMNSLQDDQLNKSAVYSWGRTRLLELEQRAGFGLLFVITLGLLLLG